MKDLSLLAALVMFALMLTANVALGFPLLGVGALVLLPWLTFRLMELLRQRTGG